MGQDAIDRFTFRFRAYIYRSIRLCLQEKEGVAASLLLCCAIDLLATFWSGEPNKSFNKRKYVAFLQRYFPPSYKPEDFYSFVRCGLLHSFNLENQYTILCNDEEWAKQVHLQIDPKRKLVVINPFVLFHDVDEAFKKYVYDIRHDMNVQKAFFVVHRQIPLKRQQISWRRMKHLKTKTA
jgi:hypothetical protein